MSLHETELITALFERLKKTAGQSKDPEAEALIRQAAAAQPEMPYYLVQTALIQELSLHQAQGRIAELERRLTEAKPAPAPAASFLGGTIAVTAAPSAAQPGYAAPPAVPAQPGYGASPAPGAGPGPGGTGGGGFLRTAEAMAAGAAAGALLSQSIGSSLGQSDAGNFALGDGDAGDVGLGNGDGDSVTVVTTQSWGQRLAGSLIGALFGIFFVIGSFFLLTWNEGRAVEAIRALDQAARQVVEVNAAAIDPQADGKIVHLTGLMETSAPARDPIFGVGGDGLLRLSRKVEMFQWEEETSTSSHTALGGSQTTKTTYSYRKVWSAQPLDSTRFHEAGNHRNPQMPVASTITDADGVRLGAYRIAPELLDKVTAFTAFDPETAPDGYQKIGEYLYRSQETGNPMVGDLRISFRAVPAQTMSVVAGLDAGGLAPFHGDNGYRIALADPGALTAGEMFREKKHEESLLTWVLRGAGFLLMLVGFAMVGGPLAVLADVLPVLGSLVSAGVFLVALTLAVPLTLITIAVAWFAHRPLAAVGMIAAGVVFAILVQYLRRRPAPATR